MILRPFLAAALVCGSLLPVNAQNPVRFATGDFIPERRTDWSRTAQEEFPDTRAQQLCYLLVQFGQPIPEATKRRLAGAGLRWLAYYPDHTYWIAVPGGFPINLLNLADARVALPFPSAYKVDPSALNPTAPTTKESFSLLAIAYDPAFPTADMRRALQAANIVYRYHPLEAPGRIFVQARAGVANQVAQWPWVNQVYLQELKDKPLNYNSRAAHAIASLRSPSGRALTGRGVTVGIGDDADISTHIDFTGRLINRSPWVPNDHGTHVSGTTAGAGIINVKNEGMAPKARLVNQFFSDILVNAPTYSQDYGMVLTNNSYFSVQVGCPGNGRYDILANFIDAQSTDFSDMLHVIAAGNDGSLTCTPYPSSYGTVKSGWQSAKNVLTVGAMNTEDYSIAYFSSRGPLRDGRIKPEIVTGGWAVRSTNANNTYGINFGTSMASPAATGALALLQERYRFLHGGANARGDLLKALLCNTAVDLGNAGPDFTFGFGMMNARKAVEALEQNRYQVALLSQGDQQSGTVVVPAGTRRLKIMLYWPDAAATANAANALVNDLDLTVETPGGSVVLPLILNATPGGLTALASPGVDRVNNIEQVVIDVPTAGIYTWRVNGFNVPLGPQPLVVTYELEQNGVQLEYPAGHEQWVPGETEVIRWTAFGEESQPFTVEYSVDNGNAWTLINNNVSANSRSLSWTVPSLTTNQALIRVSRNNSSFVDRSDTNFVILGSPTVTASRPCPGTVQLAWNAVGSATSYDILQLRGDSMQVIGTTTSTSFFVHGLRTFETAWFGVAARNGTAAGRRSVSVSALPNTGACTLSNFFGDLRADSLLTPVSARQFFAAAPQATQPVQLRIVNRGGTTVNPPISVSYRYNSTVVTEEILTAIPGNGTYVHTFTTPFTVPPAGFDYLFSAWVSALGDPISGNDTCSKRVRLLPNPAIAAMPYVEGFEGLPDTSARSAELGIANFPPMDFSASTSRGRMRTFVNSGFAHTGVRAITLDQAPYNANSTTDSLTFSYNLSNYPSSQLRFDFFYRNHGQQQLPGNKVWIRGSENNAWVEAYDLFLNQGALGSWQRALINVNDVLGSAVPPQPVTATFQLRIGQEGFTSANSPDPEIDIDDGYTIDDMVITEAFNDVALLQINSPDRAGCSLTDATPISVRLKNYHSGTLTNIQISYQINGGSVVQEVIPSMAANQTLDYTFTQTADLAAFTDYDVNVWVRFAGDNYAANDSILHYEVHNSPIIAQFPYLETFEQNDGFFYARGTNSSWGWGTPQAITINKAANGTKAWVTNLTGNYFDNETSYLYSPCFDVTALTRPMLSFSHFTDIELDYDYSWVEYSTDGKIWQRLGATGSGVNWYDNSSAANWRLSKKRWHVASIELPKPLTGNLRFRFVLSTDGGVTQEGIGIDDIHVFDLAQVYATASTASQTNALSGSNWVNFTAGSELCGAILPSGINQGDATLTSYPVSGAVRINLNQYYLNRSYQLTTAQPLQDTMRIRLFFTDAEAELLIAATGCSTCNKPRDAYTMGVTRFTGPIDQENGLLADDLLGIFHFIPDSLIRTVPFNNGYYIEFPLTGTGEFWLGAGLLRPGNAARCLGESFTLEAGTTGTTYQWQENRGSGFTNLANGLNYTGVTTASLTLDNLPSSFVAFSYRCLVDGIPQPETKIRFVAVWNGQQSDVWFAGSNWDCGNIPDPNTDVLVPGLMPHYPRVNGNAIIRSLRALAGAQVDVPSAIQLELTGQ